MKDIHTDSNFPRTSDQRVYHLGIRAGEVANRILVVGSPSRAERIATLLDANPPIFRLTSERGFLTITGRYKSVPVTIASMGMGYPNMDFWVRETRESLEGDMVVVRVGSCGGLIGLPVGSLVLPKASVAICRDYDFDFASEGDDIPYRVSKPVSANPELHDAIAAALDKHKPATSETVIKSDVVNASADSFYSSQGRLTSFNDHNEHLIDHLLATVPDLATFEMETFHLLHLASVWRPVKPHTPKLDDVTVSPTVPVANLPSKPLITQTPATQDLQKLPVATPEPSGKVKAAAVQMIFASRTSSDFITPEMVEDLEVWSGKAVLEGLIAFPIAPENLHNESGSVWALR